MIFPVAAQFVSRYDSSWAVLLRSRQATDLRRYGLLMGRPNSGFRAWFSSLLALVWE
jgi:hypothetical protein